MLATEAHRVGGISQGDAQKEAGSKFFPHASISSQRPSGNNDEDSQVGVTGRDF